MVRKLLGKITAPVRGLHQAAYLLALLTLASQVLALLRDRTFAHLFGAGETLDVYYAAFKIPDLVFALVASLVSAYVLIPLISGKHKKEMRETLSEATSFLLVVGGVLSLVLAVVAPYILPVLFPKVASGALGADFVLLTQLLLVQPLLLGLSGVFMSVTQVKRKFFLYALSPVLYNLGIILGVIVWYPTTGVMGIGFGVLVGALLHLGIHIPVVIGEGVFPRLVLPNRKRIASLVGHSLPRSSALLVSTLTALALIMIASETGTGSVSVLSFALNLSLVPLSLVAASYATAAFPVLAEHVERKDFQAFSDTLQAAARHLIFWSSVILVLGIVLRAHVVRMVLGTGAFDWDATRLTAAVLAVLLIGLISQGFVLLSSRAFYASGRSWNPLVIQLVGLVSSVGCALLLLVASSQTIFIEHFFEALLRVEGVVGAQVILIAVGATLGQLLMGVVAYVTLKQVAPGISKTLLRPLLEALGAAILGGAASYGTLTFMGTLAPLTSLFSVFTQGLVAGMVGLAVASAILILLENKEFRDVYDALQKATFARSLKPTGAVLSGPPQ
jgi:putative peptidoglycan lipid II flippase